MKIEDFIVQLAAEAAPVRRLPAVAVRFARWLLVAVLAVIICVAFFGARPDWATRVTAPAFLASFLAISGLAVVSAAAALVSSVPGHAGSRVVTVLTPILAAAWTVALAIRLLIGGDVGRQLAVEPRHAACAFQISLIALLPAVALLRSVRSGASLSPGFSGVLAVSAAVAAGAVGSAVICPIDRVAHEMLWHLLPLLAWAAAGIVIGRAWCGRLKAGG